MRGKVKFYLLKLVVMGVYFIGVSTVTATSRYTGYQPKEGMELVEMVRGLKKYK